MINWYDELKAAIEEAGDDFGQMSCTLSNDELKAEFDSGYGSTEGRPFTAWTHNWVYFPVQYDGAEWLGRAPRNPCDIATEHQGGG